MIKIIFNEGFSKSGRTLCMLQKILLNLLMGEVIASNKIKKLNYDSKITFIRKYKICTIIIFILFVLMTFMMTSCQND